MDPFDDRETISAPITDYQSKKSIHRDPVEALRVLGSSREIELCRTEQRFAVGAGSQCDIVIDDEYASSTHCVIERRAAEVLIVHDRSKNGTLVNGNLVEAAVLRPGALLTVGKTKLVILGSRSRNTLTAYERLRGKDPMFRQAVDTAIRAASADCNVLILGETGTGKELVAHAIHDASPRSAAPFVALNCGGMARDLVGSELFGHGKGAFTGAVSDREGVFARADGGTLFLDELAELPREQQPQLLRVLETQAVSPLGSDVERPVDVRLVAATNRSNALGTTSSPLRPDLYHRLATVVVELPPLRMRRGDVPILARGFVDELTVKHGPRVISRTTMRVLSEYHWPGNVRELRNSIQRAVTLCPRELMLEQLFVHRIGTDAEGQTPSMRTLPARKRRRRPRYGDSGRSLSAFDQLQRDYTLDCLNKHGSIRRAAEAMGVPKSTLCDRARRLGIRMLDGKKWGTG